MPHAKALLWELSLPGNASSSYLFGSIHLRDAQLTSIATRVAPWMQNCDLFAGEVDFDDVASETWIQNQFMDSTLRELWGIKKYTRHQHFLQTKLGFSLGKIERIWPMLSTQLIIESTLSSSTEHPMDYLLFQQAKKRGLESNGLEPIELHFDYLKSIPLNIQAGYLDQFLRNYSLHNRKLKAMTKSYLLQDIHKLYKSAKADLGKMKRSMLIQRNHLMSERLIKLADKRAGFFVVGVAHLAGYHGMLRILKHKGVRIQALSIDM